jgi:HK97 family phage major capsid protein
LADRYTELLEAAGLRKRQVHPMQHYDLAAAFQYAMRDRTDPSEAGLASFLDDEYRARADKRDFHSPHSVFIPGAAILRHIAQRTLQPYQTNPGLAAGDTLVETTLRPDLFIDALRPRSVVLSLGAQPVGGLKGDVQVPRQQTTSTAFWTTTSGSAPVVSGAITESEGSFDATPLIVAPAQVSSLGKISRQLLLQGGQLVNQVLANDVANVLGSALDLAAIAGPGTGGQPTGITNTSGVNTSSGTAFSYATSVAAVQSVVTPNAIINRRALGWAATPTVAGLLAQRVKLAAQAAFIWDGNVDTGSINKHPAISSNNVPAGTAIFGDWSQALILSWGDDATVEIEFNHYSLFSTADVIYRAMMPCNVAIRHPQSFTVVSAIT